MKLPLPEIRHDRTGFQALIRLYADTKSCYFDEIDIDMKTATWFDADMCAAFGAVLYRLGNQGNTIRIINIRPNVERILSKNGFLSHYGREKIPDRWNTTKRGPVPGGLGLKLLGEFIDLNEGCIQIVSDAGYWKRENKTTVTAQLANPFPGTVVTVGINTADTHSYSLASELSTADIF